MVFYQKDTIEGNMHSFSVKELDQLIENDLKEKKKSSKLLIGYKLFNDLMNDPKLCRSDRFSPECHKTKI